MVARRGLVTLDGSLDEPSLGNPLGDTISHPEPESAEGVKAEAGGRNLQRMRNQFGGPKPSCNLREVGARSSGATSEKHWATASSSQTTPRDVGTKAVAYTPVVASARSCALHSPDLSQLGQVLCTTASFGSICGRATGAPRVIAIEVLFAPPAPPDTAIPCCRRTVLLSGTPLREGVPQPPRESESAVAASASAHPAEETDARPFVSHVDTTSCPETPLRCEVASPGSEMSLPRHGAPRRILLRRARVVSAAEGGQDERAFQGL